MSECQQLCVWSASPHRNTHWNFMGGLHTWISLPKLFLPHTYSIISEFETEMYPPVSLSEVKVNMRWSFSNCNRKWGKKVVQYLIGLWKACMWRVTGGGGGKLGGLVIRFKMLWLNYYFMYDYANHIINNEHHLHVNGAHLCRKGWQWTNSNTHGAMLFQHI